jgi:dimethylglycine dehydrogenase
MTAAGARWGASWGLEVPIYFAPAGFEETPSLRRSDAHDLVGEECRAVRRDVGLLDISGYARYEITGPAAEPWLDRLLAGRPPGPGRARLAPMLAPSGRLQGDLVLFNWGDGTWWLMGSYYLRAWHMRWFTGHLEPGVEVRDISDAVVGFAIAGPRSRDLLARVTTGDVSNDAFPLMACRPMDVGMARARVGRLSVVGELGFEINCAAADHRALRAALLEAGTDLGVREFGFNAMMSMRLEKSFGVWSKEFRQQYTPRMTGLDRWIDWRKPDFIGREVALAERDGPDPALVLATLEVDALDADPSGYEPVWSGGRRVGYVTSGGYGHCVDRSLAMALLEPGLATPGTEITVHVVGVERGARVIDPSPYDPVGRAMRR